MSHEGQHSLAHTQSKQGSLLAAISTGFPSGCRCPHWVHYWGSCCLHLIPVEAGGDDLPLAAAPPGYPQVLAPPASQLSGLSGAGSLIRASTAWHTLSNVHAGLHAVLRMSRQISPVCSYEQQWHRHWHQQQESRDMSMSFAVGSSGLR